MYYVYEWFVKNTGEVIYVGKGTRRRYKVTKHNRFFDDFIKRFDCDSRIIKHFDTEEEAFAFEFDRIKELKEIGQCVCNINNGGEGGTTAWWNEERRKEYSKKNVMKNETQRKRMSEHNPMKNPEIAQKTNAYKQKKICIGDTVYESLAKAAIDFNVTPGAVLYWLKRGYARNWVACYYYGKPVPNVIKKEPALRTRPVFIDDTLFSSVKRAAQSINVDPSILIKALKSNKPCKGHNCRYANQQPSRGNSDKSTSEGSETNG